VRLLFLGTLFLGLLCGCHHSPLIIIVAGKNVVVDTQKQSLDKGAKGTQLEGTSKTKGTQSEETKQCPTEKQP
jgi:hypothetical protein